MSEQENKISAAVAKSDQPAKKASKKTGRKTAAKKAVAKKTGSKSTAKKAVAKKSTSKKTAGKKTAEKKSADKTSTVKPSADNDTKATAKTVGKTSGKTLSVTLVRSSNSCSARHRATVRGLGLRRMHHSVQLQDTSAIRGMLRQVAYLVRVEQL